jgi:hypothetical protein
MDRQKPVKSEAAPPKTKITKLLRIPRQWAQGTRLASNTLKIGNYGQSNCEIPFRIVVQNFVH